MRIAATLILCLAATQAIANDIEISSRPPVRQTPGTPQGAKALPSVAVMRSDASGGTRNVVTIPLDNTGIADWSYMNPRRPRIIGGNTDIEFFNQTADRRFTVATSVTLTRTDLLLLDPSATTLKILGSSTGVVRDAIAILSGTRTDIPEAPLGQIVTKEDIKKLTSNDTWFKAINNVAEVEGNLKKVAEAAVQEAAARKTVDELISTADATIDSAKTLAEKIEARQNAEDEVRKSLESHAQERAELISDIQRHKAKVENDIILEQRKADNPSTTADEKTKAEAALKKLDPIPRTLDAAIFVLETQSDETPLLLAARQRFRNVEMEDCTVSGNSLACTAVIRLQPNTRDSFPREVLLLQPDRGTAARFTVSFFQEVENPANQTAYLVAAELAKKLSPPKSVGTLTAVAAIGGAIDPSLESRSDPAFSLNCPTLCAHFPYTTAHNKHLNGTGNISVKQTFGNLLDGSVKLGFKKGDLGGGSKTLDVALSQYEFHIYSETGLQFHFGKGVFAGPTSKIAINESGEGFRFLYDSFAISHVTKRESAAETANRGNRDSYAWLGEYRNIDLSGLPPFRRMSVIVVDGTDNKANDFVKHPTLTDVKRPTHTAHRYRSFGGEATYGFPKWRTWGTLAAYWNQRTSRTRGDTCGNGLTVCDGRGQVGLLTVTRPIGAAAKVTRTLTATIGLGSPDNPSTPNIDESYSGENVAYAPDQIFLSSLAAAVSGRDFVDPSKVSLDTFLAEDIGALGIGPGLSNKRYIGLSYSDKNFSPLEAFARGVFKVPASDIKSRSTTITLNHYRLRSEFLGGREAGREIDAQFDLETPKGVTVTIGAGYFWPGGAIKPIVKKNVWSVSSLISIAL